MTETQDAALAADEGAASSARPGDEMLPFLNNRVLARIIPPVAHGHEG